MIAFVFPGQGARNVLGAVKFAKGSKLLSLATTVDLEANGGRALERTDVLQPVLVAVCLTIHAELVSGGMTPGLVFGHSLGELPAFAAAGVITPEEAVQLAVVRGALMAREAAKYPGGLVALDSLDAARASGLGLAAVNAPDEVVVSGLEADLKRVKGRRIPTSGAWHSEAMSGAVGEFRTALSSLRPASARVPIINDLDGTIGHSLDALADQLTRPVQFVEMLKTAVARGVDTFVTVGPGAVLRGLIRKNLGTTVRVLTTEDEADLRSRLRGIVK